MGSIPGSQLWLEYQHATLREIMDRADSIVLQWNVPG